MWTGASNADQTGQVLKFVGFRAHNQVPNLFVVLPDGCVNGNVLATNLSSAPRSCKSCVTVNLVMMSRQIFVHVCD